MTSLRDVVSELAKGVWLSKTLTAHSSPDAEALRDVVSELAKGVWLSKTLTAHASPDAEGTSGCGA